MRSREKTNAYAAKWRNENPEKMRVIYRKCQLKRFGLTIEEFNALADAQGGVCAICGGPPQKNKSLAVDHCHETGIVRGLLCQKCNRAIGWLGDSLPALERATDYLRCAYQEEPDDRADGFV